MANFLVTAVSLASVLGASARPGARLLRARVQPAATSVVVPCHPQPWELDAENDTRDENLVATHAFFDRFRKVLAGSTAEMFSTGRSTCRATGDATDRHAFTVVRQKGPMLCESTAPEEFRFDSTNSFEAYTVHTFYAPRNLPAGGKTRMYAEAWPAADVCTSGAPCPLIVSLHGVSSQSDPQKLKTWAYLNSYVQDASCRQSLRSVMIFPRLSDQRAENFTDHGTAILGDFIVPLVEQFLALNHNVDGKRVALVGTGEGALGAFMASILHPDVFSIVVAAAASAPLPHFPQVPLPLRKSQASDKLRAILIAWDGAHEASMSQMGEALSQLVHAGTPTHAAVRGRLYLGMDRMETAESVLNHYEMLHWVLWRGYFDLAGQLW